MIESSHTLLEMPGTLLQHCRATTRCYAQELKVGWQTYQDVIAVLCVETCVDTQLSVPLKLGSAVQRWQASKLFTAQAAYLAGSSAAV